MAISIDWGTKTINIPKSYLSNITGSLYELDTETFREDLKALEDDPEGMPFPDTHQHYTEVTVAGVTYARFIIIINGYSITFEDGQYSVRLAGSNNNFFDVENGILNQNQVQVIPGNSAGLIKVVQGSGVTENDKLEIAQLVWSEPEPALLDDKIQFIVDLRAGRLLIDKTSFQEIHYKSDNITEVARFNLLDSDGAPSHTEVYERVRVTTTTTTSTTSTTTSTTSTTITQSTSTTSTSTSTTSTTTSTTSTTTTTVDGYLVLQDDFSGSSLDTGKWTESNNQTASVTVNNQLELNTGTGTAHCGAHIYSDDNFNKTGTIRLEVKWKPGTNHYSSAWSPKIDFCKPTAGRDANYGARDEYFVALFLRDYLNTTDVEEISFRETVTTPTPFTTLDETNTPGFDESVWHDVLIEIDSDTRIFHVEIDGYWTLNGTIGSSAWSNIGSTFKLELGNNNYERTDTEYFKDLKLYVIPTTTTTTTTSTSTTTTSSTTTTTT
jgi:hypothetical protein